MFLTLIELGIMVYLHYILWGVNFIFLALIKTQHSFPEVAGVQVSEWGQNNVTWPHPPKQPSTILG